MFLWPSEIGGALSKLEADPTDDWVDRFNYVQTVALIIFFATLIGTKQHFGSPIQCMTPAEFPGTWTNYAHDYCFVSNTYTLNVTTALTGGISTGTVTKQEIVYYQWVPYILAIQAFLFMLPKIFWNTITSFNGLDMRSVVEETVKLRTMKEPVERSTQLARIAAFALQYLHLTRSNSLMKLVFGQSFFTIFYIISKWLYVAVTLFQLNLLNRFVGDGTVSWGFDLLHELLTHRSLRKTPLFPRVTLCDFNVPYIAQENTFSVQCVLMVNILNEKIFLILWVWLNVLAVLNITSALFTTIAFSIPSIRRARVLHMLQVDETKVTTPNGCASTRFVREYLQPDNALLLWFVSNRAGGLVANELAWHMCGLANTAYKTKRLLSGQGWSDVEKDVDSPIDAYAEEQRRGRRGRSPSADSRMPARNQLLYDPRGPPKVPPKPDNLR